MSTSRWRWVAVLAVWSVAGCEPSVADSTTVPATSVPLNSFTLTVGTQQVLSLSDRRMATWNSSDSSVASVSQTGLVFALRPGSARIDATSEADTRSFAITVVAASQPAPAAPSPGAATRGHANEPANFSVLDEMTFDSLNANGWVETQANNPRIVIDSTSPVGSRNVAEMFYPAGFASGAAPGAVRPSSNRFPARPTSIYVSFWVKISPNWVGQAAGTNKIGYMMIDEANRGSFEFVAMGGIDPSEQTLAPMIVLENVNVTAGAPNRGASGSPSVTLVPNMVPYTTSAAVPRGTWGHYEILMTMNSAPGVADGGIKWWWNGQLYGDFTGHVDWNRASNSAFTSAYWEPTYGGLGPAVPADQFMWMKDLYISGR